MSDKHLHIVMHDVPWPADFGGVVDLFYKLKSLHAAGLKIHLHCFLNKRPKQESLQQYCETVNYYKRQQLTALSLTIPFVVNSRKSDLLLLNLQKDNHPILFEGIHCTYYLYRNKLKGRKIFLRLHNVEYRYYEQLAKHENNFLRKIYFKHEAKLLKKYERAIANEAQIITVSTHDAKLYEREFAANNIIFLPVFLPYEHVSSLEGAGKYCLYHGNLAINENETAALWLMEKMFNTLQIPLVIAGRNPSKRLKEVTEKYPFVSVVANPTEKNMQLLIKHAQINVLPSFNKTGVKLKLLNALYNGRHCIVNNAGTEGSGLNELCIIAENDVSFIQQISVLFKENFTLKEMQRRSTALKNLYNNKQNAQLIIDMLP
ncbi:MAG: glycosyltransferase [Ferruginibacter sp.]